MENLRRERLLELSVVVDDLFIFAPSMLVEGKAIGTAKLDDLFLLKTLTTTYGVNKKQFAKARKSGRTVGQRKLAEVQDSTRRSLLRNINLYYAGTIDEVEFRKRIVKRMKETWRDVFYAGLRAGGIPGTGSGKTGVRVKLAPGEQKWLKSAMTHEMRFLNGFVQAVVDETYRIPLPQRVQMYVKTLKSFYDSARVIALPVDVVIHWSGPVDDRKCPSCVYLQKHSPYTKLSLPCVPRDGTTICLFNCRDKLVIRRAKTAKQAVDVTMAGRTRKQYIDTLRRIKVKGK